MFDFFGLAREDRVRWFGQKRNSQYVGRRMLRMEVQAGDLEQECPDPVLTGFNSAGFLSTPQRTCSPKKVGAQAALGMGSGYL